MTIPARIVGDANGAAVLASFDAPAQGGRPAGFDCGHDAPLDPAEMAVIGAPKGLAVTAQDVGEFEVGSASGHRRSVGRRDLQLQTVEWALRRADRVGRHLRVARGRGKIVVAEQAWMILMSVPFSRRWVAKLWRSVCRVTRLSSPAAFVAERHAA